MAENKSSKPDKYDTDHGFTPDDPEYWALMARTLGNPVPDYDAEAESQWVDENGVVIATPNEK